jgi:phospholipase/lecithinase/hemolysin
MKTIQRDHAEKALELAQVRAARHGESIDIPIIFTTGEGPAENITRLVIFGDSLSDTGNLKSRLVVFPAAPYWIGRFSNGPVWVDYLEADQNVAIRNYSYGGASVTWHGHKPGEGVVELIKQGGQYFVTGSLEQQVEDYISDDLNGELLQRPDKTLFVIWVGANDYIWKEPFTGTISTFLNSPKGEAGFERVVDEVISTMAVEISKLYRAGGRIFLVMNLPDIGRSPMVLQNSTYFAPTSASSEEARRVELSRRLTNLTEYHNGQLTLLAEDLVSRLPGVQLNVVDTNRTVRKLLNEDSEDNPGQTFDYGFALDQNLEIIASKNNVVALQKRCYSGGYLGTSDKHEVCARQEAAMFWDTIHPTTLTHCWQAFFIGQTLVELDMNIQPHSLEDQRDWCLRVSRRARGHSDSEWSLR